MTIFISIVGLGLLVFVHELGHFTASVALRMHPRKFYIGFPPAIVNAPATGSSTASG
jgi:membrane-associated protease RseP (regulator of RpoE activity)